MNEFIRLLAYLRILGMFSSFGCCRKKNSKFLWIFCDVPRMKRVETLKCLPSMKGFNAHVFQKLDWKYLDFRRINDAIYIKTHKWVFQLRQFQSHILERRILLKGFYYIILLYIKYYNIIQRARNAEPPKGGLALQIFNQSLPKSFWICPFSMYHTTINTLSINFPQATMTILSNYIIF